MANRFSTVGQSFIALGELDARVWCWVFMKDKLYWFEPQVYSKIMNAYVSIYLFGIPKINFTAECVGNQNFNRGVQYEFFKRCSLGEMENF